MKNRLIQPTLFVLLFGLIISCGGGPPVQQDEPVYSAEASTALLMDEVLATVIEIQNQSVSRDENGVILAETLIKNKTSGLVTLEVRCMFKDEMGLTKETSPWKTIQIPPQGRQIYVAPSLNRSSQRFMVHIRLPDTLE